MNHIDALWVEKYRPKNMDDVVMPSVTKQMIGDFLAKGNIPHFIFSGDAGVGKTTTAYAIAATLNADVLFINASLENGIDILRTKVDQFASTVSLTGAKKIVVLDEADNLSQSFQPALRGFMEQYSDNVRFILTCNYKNKIIPAIQSRCTLVDFKIDKTEKTSLQKTMFLRCSNILDTEGIDYDKKTVVEIVKKKFPDFRKVIGTLQELSVSGTLDSSNMIDNSANIDVLIEILRQKQFSDMRQWVSNNVSYSETGTVSIIDQLYERFDDVLESNSIPQAILILADYSYKSSFVINQQINMAAMLTELMGSVKFS